MITYRRRRARLTIMIRTTLAIGASLYATAVHAKNDCKTIEDLDARIACFNRGPKPPANQPKKVAPKLDAFAVAKAAVSRKLTDPASARFSDLFQAAGPAGASVICGMVDVKNRAGAYAGAKAFIYLPAERLAVLMFNEVADPEPASYGLQAYCSYCANADHADAEIRTSCK